VNALPTAELIAQHEPQAGVAHVVVIAAVAVTALVVIGVSRWQRRRAQAEQRPSSQDRPAKTTRSGDQE
jgi:uncharacterized iron-regulated membrane protein